MYNLINIPGGTTGYEDNPDFKLISNGDCPAMIIIKYNAYPITETSTVIKFGELIFQGVLEFRWIHCEIDYSPFNPEDLEFGLIEIIDSKYIEDIISKNPWKDFPDQPFGPFRAKSKVKHYRLVFDKYAEFDIIAANVSIREIIEKTS